MTLPPRFRDVMRSNDGGLEWLDSIPARVARAVERWDLVVGEPFEEGMAAWTAPATTAAGVEVVLKVSWPCRDTRDEAAALAAWHGAGAVEVLDADADDSALLLRRLRPGSTLRDARLAPIEHLSVGAELLRRMAAVPVREGEPFLDLVEAADRLAVSGAERLDRLLPIAPVPIDAGVCRQAVDLLRTLPGDASVRGLAHGDFNPGNILLHVDTGAGGTKRSGGWWRSTRSRSTATWRGTRGRCSPRSATTGPSWCPTPPSWFIVPDSSPTWLASTPPGPRRGAWLAVWSMRSGRPTVAGGPASWARTAIWPGRPPGRKR